ncbi:MAG: type II toxin-antitoxin system VapC family toxin [Pyrinomonadaceae bacterium]
MAAYFFDSSALVKRYAREVGTTWVISLFRSASANRIYAGRIASVEVISALTRRSRSGRLAQNTAARAIGRFRRAFAGKFRKVELTERLIERATALAEKHALRGYDAVHLAAALEANDGRIALATTPITLISADEELNAAAAAEGLAVDNPNNHP